MKDEQTIKALELCNNGICKGCPYYDVKCCMAVCRRDALNLIKQQQAEIEKLTAENKKIHKAWSEDLQDKIKSLHKLNEQLDDLRLEKYGIKSVNKAVPVTKATERYIERKACNEFAERLKSKAAYCSADKGEIILLEEDFVNTLEKLTEESNGE